MRIPSSRMSDRHRLDVQMTPMIDVVFLLLVFFVWTASFRVVERLLPSQLAASAGAGTNSQPNPETIDFDLLVVRMDYVDGNATWLVNDQPQTTWEALQSRLMTVANIKSDLPVVVDPDAIVPLGHVIEVYDLARQVGFDSIQFVADATANGGP